jgi:hypothetical protein
MQSKLIQCLCNLFKGTTFELLWGKIGAAVDDAVVDSEAEV